MNKKLLLVPSTHWDREWYKSQSEFSVYLTELFELVLTKLESGELGNYFTDGQAVMVEDILTLKPEWQQRIAEFASCGKLELGPFYVLTDMYMPSGESFFRNISYGIEIIRKLGGKPGIPYAPDAFGHNADLPAILNSAGFDAYFFCRGIGDQLDPPRSEFIWRDRNDRYKVLALSAIVDIFHPVTGRWISGAYGLGMNLPQKQDEFNERLDVIWSYLEKYSDLPVQLAVNGSDHLLPEENLAQRIDRFNAQSSTFTAETAPIAEYVSEAWKNLDTDKLPSVAGELIAGKFFRILTGTSSSRINLKIRNAKIQYLLEKIVEPAMALADDKDRILYMPHLDNAWKWLLQNQAHDSICGCSVDAVHREMCVRYDKIESSAKVIAERLLRYESNVKELRAFMPAADSELIKVAVTHNISSRTKGTLWNFSFVLPANIELENYALVDNDGNEHDYFAVKDEPASTTNGPYIPAGPQGRLCDRLTVYTAMDVADGFAGTSMFFRKKNGDTAVADRKIPLSVKDGKIVLETQEYQVADFLSLIDTQDVGDEYDFRGAENGKIFTNQPWREVEVCTKNTIYRAVFATSVTVPSSAKDDTPVVLNVEMEVIGAFADSNFVCRFHVGNFAEDHRLQLHVRTPFDFKEYCRQSQFYHDITPVERMTEPDSWRDKVEPLRRNFGYISIAENDKKFAVMPCGIHEHTTDGASFDLTLIRSVGNLGQSGAGPHIRTPEAQIQGNIMLNVAFAWSGDGTDSNALWHDSSRLLYSSNGVVLHPDIESVKFDDCKYHLESETLVISAFFFDKDSGRRIVRIFNPASCKGSGALKGGCIPASLNRVGYNRGTLIVTDEVINSSDIALEAGEIAAFALN